MAATGTGKTMVAAFDFLRLYKEIPQTRLLFLAHREEILRQSCKTYRAVLKDHNFGEYWVAGQTPSRYEHVFASIQTLNAGAKYRELPRDHFDVIVLESYDSKIITKKLLLILPVWYNGSSFLYVENA